MLNDKTAKLLAGAAGEFMGAVSCLVTNSLKEAIEAANNIPGPPRTTNDEEEWKEWLIVTCHAALDRLQGRSKSLSPKESTVIPEGNFDNKDLFVAEMIQGDIEALCQKHNIDVFCFAGLAFGPGCRKDDMAMIVRQAFMLLHGASKTTQQERDTLVEATENFAKYLSSWCKAVEVRNDEEKSGRS